MRALLQAQDCRDLDRWVAQQLRISGVELMQRAAQAALDVLVERWPEAARVTVFCGKGNNAGDGYLLAALARQLGIGVQVIQVDPRPLEGDAGQAQQQAFKQGIVPSPAGEPISGEVIVDALLGTGLQGLLQDPYEQAVHQINQHPAPVLALDIPTGVVTDTGAIAGDAVVADVTVTFIADKIGLHTGAAVSCVGELLVRNLGAPVQDRQAGIPLLFENDFLQAQIDPDTYKHARGHLLVIGGDHDMGGAALLSAEAALRSGAGLVTVATRIEHRSPILARRPELMVIDAEDQLKLASLLEKADAIAIGPGLGSGQWARSLMHMVQAISKPILVDADGLRLWQREQSQTPVVLTPHVGEAAAMLDVPISVVQADRCGAAAALTERFAAAVILKGPGSIVSLPQGTDSSLPDRLAATRLGICGQGNPGMATAGMGDVLSGIAGALLAAGESAGYAAAYGMCLHSQCGDRAASRRGQRAMLASDVIDALSVDHGH